MNDEVVYIPRIILEPADTLDPTNAFKRLQFSLRLAYALTINKSQGQTFGKVCYVSFACLR